MGVIGFFADEMSNQFGAASSSLARFLVATRCFCAGTRSATG